MPHALAAVLFAQGLAHQMRWNDVGTTVRTALFAGLLFANLVMHHVPALCHFEFFSSVGFLIRRATRNWLLASLQEFFVRCNGNEKVL